MTTIMHCGEEKKVYGTATARTRKEAVRKAWEVDKADAGFTVFDIRRGGLGYFVIVRDA
jgi:hypothetical protein